MLINDDALFGLIYSTRTIRLECNRFYNETKRLLIRDIHGEEYKE